MMYRQSWRKPQYRMITISERILALIPINLTIPSRTKLLLKRNRRLMLLMMLILIHIIEADLLNLMPPLFLIKISHIVTHWLRREQSLIFHR